MSNLLNVTGSQSNSKDEPVQKVKVSLLENLMNLAGELVLSRNQLIQGIDSEDMKAIELSGQRIDLITSELQESIMKTRMDKIAGLFDLFIENVEGLGRNIKISVEGNEVELDKSVLEGIEIPLKNLLENIIEYGIEEMEQRRASGKNPMGQIIVKAFQDAGQINITMGHDGDDENGNILTREIASQIEEIGGLLEVDKKSSFVEYMIKLPLTLAIIPSQITSVGNEKYAIPQANLSELIRIPANDVRNRIETVGDAEVVRIRGELLPVLNLPVILGIERTWTDEDGEVQIERRRSLSDRRSKKYTENGIAKAVSQDSSDLRKRSPEDRRKAANKALNIAVVHAGNFKYGLLIDELHDSEEIVVKPLGRHLKKYKNFAGATIMGDGKVALILDILNIAQNQNLSTKDESKRLVENIESEDSRGRTRESLVLFKNLEREYFAAPFTSVERIERIPSSTVETVSNRKVVQYRGGALPLYELSDILKVEPLPLREQIEVIVFDICDRQFGLIVTPPVDTVDVDVILDESTLKQLGVRGSMIIDKHTTLLLDIVEIAELFLKNYEV